MGNSDTTITISGLLWEAASKAVPPDSDKAITGNNLRDINAQVREAIKADDFLRNAVGNPPDVMALPADTQVQADGVEPLKELITKIIKSVLKLNAKPEIT